MSGLEKISQSFREHLSSGATSWIFVLLAIAVIVLLVAFFRMFFSPAAQQRRARRAQFRLFAGANGLTSAESGLLFKVATYYQMEDPSLIFVKRSVFEQAANSLGIDPLQADSIRRKVYAP